LNYATTRDVPPSQHSKPLRHTRSIALSACALALACLSGCAYAPAQGAPGQIISRLPPSAPGAAPAAPELTQAEKDRYKEIDKQVMDDQDARDRALEWADIVEATPVYYSGYSYYTPYPYAAYPAYPVYPSYQVYPPGYGYQYGW